MSQAGGPHGQHLGVLKCVNKRPLNHSDKWSVAFVGDTASAVFTLSKEDAEYFTEGQSYSFRATQP
jgi:hypothetical protein